MRFAALAVAFILAACQPATTAQRDSGPVTVDGVTFAQVAPDKRAILRSMITDNRTCEIRVAQTMPTMNADPARRACQCVADAYVANVPEDIVDRHIAEARGTARNLEPWEAQNLMARLVGELRLSYAKCGLRYD